MNLEQELFNKYKVDFNKLSLYGFTKELDYYVYYQNFFDNNFQAIIKINKEGIVSGTVIDLDTKLEYTNIRVENIGSFANKVKELYKEILINIRNNCFDKNLFIYDEANKICEYIINKYNDKPEFLWDKYPNFCVFRNSKNKKWYALLADIKGGIFDKIGDISIINVKIDECELENLLKIEGIYKAYHMNKKSWISIILDDTLSLDEIKKIVDKSYEIIDKKG